MTDRIDINGRMIPVSYIHTLVLGSGAASLAAAVRLRRFGISDLCIVTDNLNGGTSRNTGSDKQTYYKLGDSDPIPDSPYEMAESIHGGGAVHGDIALVESLCSSSAYYHLVGLGVPFPFNRLGGYTGYKTDHDPRKRGTSLGPYTSKIMVEHLEREARMLSIPVKDHTECVKLLRHGERICGALFLDKKKLDDDSHGFRIMLCDNMVFGLGGPGGLYSTSVYPPAHTGGIGLALEAGIEAVNLTESQYGIGSVKFRWNLSGSYQQIIPSYYSICEKTGERVYFLNDFFDSMEELAKAIFLKGYQWPFDPQKIESGGSSLIDLLVYREIEVHGRKVFLDFRENPQGDGKFDDFSPEVLSPEARDYWENSGVTGATPIERLKQMNSASADLYKKHHIDLEDEALQIAVCAQHNNGGLAGDLWWESVNCPHFFPIGEINGSHGIYRPGGTALNSGQVGAFRSAQKIANAYADTSLDAESALEDNKNEIASFLELVDRLLSGNAVRKCELGYQKEFQMRMSRAGALVRSRDDILRSTRQASDQLERFSELRIDKAVLPFAMKQRHLAVAQYCYLEAIKDYLNAGGGSRGSFLVLETGGRKLHPGLESIWDMKKESGDLKSRMQSLRFDPDSGKIFCQWNPCRSIPQDDFWFENVWSEYLQGDVFR